MQNFGTAQTAGTFRNAPDGTLVGDDGELFQIRYHVGNGGNDVELWQHERSRGKGHCMYLIHVLLPLQDNQGRPHGRELFRAVAGELIERFGGLTAHTRAPAEGLWKEDSSGTSRDEIVIYEVMAEELDGGWWGEYRRGLEARFRQEQVVVRAQEVRLL